jgi:hypothetical protein
MLARVKLKGIDGGPHKRWSMWFNSMQREEPYQGLTCPRADIRGEPGNWETFFVRGDKLGCTGGAWLSSARVVRRRVQSRNERNPYHLDCEKLVRLPVTSRRKVRMTSSQHAPYALGDSRATMAGTKSCYSARRR